MIHSLELVLGTSLAFAIVDCLGGDCGRLVVVGVVLLNCGLIVGFSLVLFVGAYIWIQFVVALISKFAW